MGWSGGSYSKGNSGTGGWVGDASLGIGIEAGRHDTQDNDFAAGINQCLNKDGSNSCTGDLNLGGFKPVNLAAGTAAAPAICAGGDVDTGMYSPGADRIGFATAGIERVTIDSSGSVNLSQAGSSPVAKFSLLQYSNDSQTSQLQFYKSKSAALGGNTIVANGDQIGMLRFYGANGTSYTEGARITAAIDGTPGATNDMPTHLAFFTTADGSGTPAERMRIDSSGRVGIGTNAPSATAHISGQVANAIGTGIDQGQLFLSDPDLNTSGLSLGYYYQSGIGEYARIQSRSASGASNLVIQGGGGLVGINTTALGGATGAQLTITNSSNGRAALQTRGISGDLAEPSIDIIKFDNNTTTSQNFVEFYINNAAQGSGKITANGVGAAAFGSFSDERLKENIQDLPNQLTNILALRPVEFDYKDGSGHQLGFIAQEVQPIFPDLVGESDGYLTLTDLNKNDARLIKAFQELAAKVVALEARVAELEA